MKLMDWAAVRTAPSWRRIGCQALLGLALLNGLVAAEAPAKPAEPAPGDDLFSARAVPRVRIEIPPAGIRTLRSYQQERGQPRPERVDVAATVREGPRVYTNVMVHLKGSYSFQPLDAKPSFTLNFDKAAKDQRFHGLKKIHLNNSTQDASFLCEELARDLFNSNGVPATRAGHATVELNGRQIGMYVLIEGWDKEFLRTHFASVKGNLYDGGSGGDITKALKVDCGANPDDRSDLTALIAAAREPDITKRTARLSQLLDVDQFLTFVAMEAILVHWDGYSMGPNNYRLFHDAARDKMVFMPHGMDQLFGKFRPVTMSITPNFNGIVARGLIAIPEMRQRYLERVENLLTNQFRPAVLNQKVDRMAARIRPTVSQDQQEMQQFESEVESLKSRIQARVASVRQQLRQPERPVQFDTENTVRPSAWQFKTTVEHPASGRRMVDGGREVLQVLARGTASTGSWRDVLLLEEGHYELSGRGRTEGSATPLGKDEGVILRVSGERSTEGMSTNSNWTDLTYQFDVHGIANTELVAEYRGRTGAGNFDPASFKLVRKGTAATKAVPKQ